MRSACLTLVLAFSSCGGEPEPTRPTPPPPESEQTTASVPPTTTATTAPAASSVTPVPAGPAPTLAFVATPGPDGIVLSIANHGSSEASLRAQIEVEVDHEGTFTAAPSASSLTLRYDCSHEAEDCTTLAPGAELLPPSWLGTWGDMQCVCTRCGPVEAGTYRLVATTCDGAHRIESNAFALPAR